VRLDPSTGTTVVVGPNGQGKTNLLEAVYFLAALKPLRGTRLSDLVRFGESAAFVEGTFELGGALRTIGVEVTDGARQALVDGKKVTRLEDYFGGLSAVAFTPEDLSVVKEGPDLRRRFLDRAVFNRFPRFLAESRAYLRALKARNRLVKTRADAAYLEAYDEALAQSGARILIRRRELLRELGPRAEAAFEAIGRGAAGARFAYAPAHWDGDFEAQDESILQKTLLAQLRARLPRDLERGFTSVGPHADDVRIELGGKPARTFASQGQQRALVLAWKVAEIENLEASLGYLPLLLLDDVSSELDPERNAYLMHHLAQSGAQVFLTTTDPRLVQEAVSASTLWFDVFQGQVTPRKNASLE
jgi:DNA replication and repair protein RecF